MSPAHIKVATYGGAALLLLLLARKAVAAPIADVSLGTPTIDGIYALTATSTLYATSGTGTCTTGPSVNVGNNVEEDNIAALTAISAATVNAAIAAGFPYRLGTLAIPTGTTGRQ